MAKSIYICSRNNLLSNTETKLTNISHRLAPDNIRSRKPLIQVKEKTAFAVINPSDNVFTKDDSILLGCLFSCSRNWHKPREEYPDGSFALFRSSNELCEMVSDAAGSRTIWYYFNDNIFISSTSQRAIIMYINSFEFNEKAIPWMLSSGSLGPEFSWDNRIKRIPPNSSIILNKLEWTLEAKKHITEFKERKLPYKEHKTILRNKLKATFDQFKPDLNKWYLPLSGGYDSRGILCFLQKTSSQIAKLTTITWGVESAINDTETDAFIAKKLASHYQVSHKYYSTNQTDESIEIIFNRFLRIGEGRIDHISGYMDGFKIWKTLYEDGVQGIIRGDEGFGWNDDGAISALFLRRSTGCSLCNDYSNLRAYRKYGIPKQVVPNILKRRPKETLAMWRDRIYHEYRLPTIIAALTDLKVSYVEQVSPLLSRNILNYVRNLPDHLRTDKYLFKEIVNDISPDIKYASKNAIANSKDILKSNEVITLFARKLSSPHAKSLFHEDFLNLILNNLKVKNSKNQDKVSTSNTKQKIMDMAPNFFLNFIRKYIIKPKLDYNVIAFRIFIICSIHQLFDEDSNVF